jgi:bifunctional non-homologous end joining protein LigD
LFEEASPGQSAPGEASLIPLSLLTAMPERRARNDPLEEYRKKRDFGRTSEPPGIVRGAARHARLEFVIQEHDATNLHFDLRLESAGVMKSWAVPRGPTFDPSVKRLAMEVEDHPMDYNYFEGTIPSSEYGGGTVMVWDRGTYFPDKAPKGADEQAVVEREHAAGKMDISFVGERMKGSYALVRTEAGAKPKWLLIKHRDEHARRGVDAAEEHKTSIITGRTLEEIALEDATDGFQDAGIAAMLYRYATEPPAGRGWVFEPAIRGARVHVYVTADALQLVTAVPGAARKYKGVAAGLKDHAARIGRSFVLDGEIQRVKQKPILFVFDLVFEDGKVLIEEAWTERRKLLEKLLSSSDASDVELVPVVRRGGASLLERARNESWRGIVARKADSPYRAGERSGDWIKTVFPGKPFVMP